MASMEELFPEFYIEKLTSIDFKREKNNLIVLDTNILSDILGLPTDLAEKYLDTIEAVKDHLFIPYIVGLEYHFNKQSIKMVTEIQRDSYAESIVNEIRSLVENFKDKGGKDPLGFLRNKNQKKEVKTKLLEILKIDDLEAEINKIFDEKYTKDVSELQERLKKIINDSVAEKLTQEWIDKVQEKGGKRYEQQIPPGINDSKKDYEKSPNRTYAGLTYSRKYGDYILWEELLHKLSKDGKSLGNKVIFVTNDGISDRKSDLLYKQSGRTIGPRIELMTELWNLNVGYDINNPIENTEEKVCKELYIINSERFIQLVNELSDEDAKHYRVQNSLFGGINDDEDDDLFNLNPNPFYPNNNSFNSNFNPFYPNNSSFNSNPSSFYSNSDPFSSDFDEMFEVQNKIKSIDNELKRIDLERSKIEADLWLNDVGTNGKIFQLEEKRNILDYDEARLIEQKNSLEHKKSKLEANKFGSWGTDDDLPF